MLNQISANVSCIEGGMCNLADPSASLENRSNKQLTDVGLYQGWAGVCPAKNLNRAYILYRMMIHEPTSYVVQNTDPTTEIIVNPDLNSRATKLLLRHAMATKKGGWSLVTTTLELVFGSKYCNV